MKSKILSIAIILMAFTSSFAETGKGYRILYQEMHASPASEFYVKQVPPRNPQGIEDCKCKCKENSHTIQKVKPKHKT